MAISFPDNLPHGGKRANSGRKSDKRIKDFCALFDKVVPPDRMARMIETLAKDVEDDGDVHAFVALMNRRYGRVGPKEEDEENIMIYLDR